MNINKRGLLRNLTNGELKVLLDKNDDQDILREYIDRCSDGRIRPDINNIGTQDKKVLSSFVGDF